MLYKTKVHMNGWGLIWSLHKIRTSGLKIPTDVMDVLWCKVSLELLLLFKLRNKNLIFVECLYYVFHAASHLKKA